MRCIASIPRRAVVATAVLVPALVLVNPPAGAVTLGDVSRAAADWRTAASSSPAEPGALLASLARVDALPLRCATPVLMTLSQAPENAALLAALQPARAFPEERTLVTRDGRFLLRDVPPGGAGGRDYETGAETVARVLEALVSARASMLAQGWPEPAPDRVTVVLGRLGHGLEGYVIPGRSGAHPGSAVVVLDATLAAERIAPAVLHQVAHLSLLTLTHGFSWWHEATAGYLTVLGGGAAALDRPSLAARLEATSRGLDSDDLAMLPGALLWPLFLADRTGDPLVVRQIWQAVAEEMLDPLAAADAVLQRRGLSLAAAVREMAVWNLFTGTRADARHYALGRDLPEAAIADLGPDLPLSNTSPEPVEPTGSLAYRLPAGAMRGALRVTVAADGGAPAADLLLFSRAREALPLLVPVPLTEGRGETSVPWSDAREAWIVLRNAPDAGEAGAARFDLSLDVDPRAPFDLASFAATQVGRSLVLEWTTASESALTGWNVYRGESPDGPFVRLNSVALPAYGDGAADTGYLFVDEGARTGRRYYYEVEGVTSSGLAQRSHTASARINP